MAARATVSLENIWIRKLTIASGQTATLGLAVIYSGSDTEIATAAAASDLAIGVALQTGVAGDIVEVACFSPGSIKVKVGTGGATRGTKAKLVTDGFTDAAADNGGTTAVPTYGVFTETGVAGDLVGLMPAIANRTAT